MPKKPKFKPVITRIKLNPEQAVLTCFCYDSGWTFRGRSGGGYVAGDGPSMCLYGDPRGTQGNLTAPGGGTTYYQAGEYATKS